MNTKTICGIGFVLLLSLIVPVAAHADVISITFTATPLLGSPGDTLTFNGTIANSTDSDLWLNRVGVTLAGGFPDPDYDSFFENFSASALTSGASFGPADLFTITIPDGFTSGSYSGTLVVEGGASGDSEDNLGSASFHVDVQDAGSSVPEPGTLGLTALSIGALALRFRRRHTA